MSSDVRPGNSWVQMAPPLLGIGVLGYGAAHVVASLIAKIAGAGPVRGPSGVLDVARSYVVPFTIVMVLVAAGLVWLAWLVYRWWWARAERDMFRRLPGMGRPRQAAAVGGAKVILKRAGALRPAVEKPRIEDVAYPEGKVQGLQLWSSVEDSTLVLGPPRSGKGHHVVINRVLDSVGAVVTTSTRPDNLTVALKAREKDGRPVVVFDPEGLAPGLPVSDVKWSPVRGCEDARTAAVRGRGFAAAGFPATGENQIWQTLAATVLRSLLHAAALRGLGAKDLYRWSTSHAQAIEAVDILNSEPGAVPGWGQELKAAIEQDPRTRDSVWMGVRQSIAGLGDPRVLDAVTPLAGESLDPAWLLRERGTIFMIGTAQGAVTSASLITAFIEDVVQTAKVMAASSPGARMDPPLTLVLDEAANYPLPSLGQLMSEGGGSGISTMAVLQSLAQARNAWGADEAQAIWDSATVKIVLGGSANSETLRDISAIVGERDDLTASATHQGWASMVPASMQESVRRVPILSPDQVRQLPFGLGLLMLRSAPPVIVDLKPWRKRKDADELAASATDMEGRISSAFAAQQAAQQVVEL